MALGAMNTVCRVLAVDAASVEIIAIHVSRTPVIIIKTCVIPRIVLPLIIVFLIPVSRGLCKV